MTSFCRLPPFQTAFEEKTWLIQQIYYICKKSEGLILPKDSLKLGSYKSTTMF